MSTTTATRPPAPGPGNTANSQWPSGHPRRRLILLVLCLSLLVVVIDNTILNTALPTLARVLHAGTSSLQWISDAYTLCFAALLIPAGALGDRYGRRLSLLGGLTVFAARQRRGGVRVRHRHADRRAGRDGPGRGVRHAGHAVDPERGLPAEGAPAGHRRLVGRDRHRHRDRPDARRPAAHALLVGQRVPHQHPAGRPRAGRRAPDRARDRRARRPPPRHPRHGAHRRRAVRHRRRHHRGARPGLDRRPRRSPKPPPGWPRSPSSPGGSCASRTRSST